MATGHADATPPELPLLGQTHATLEPSYGVFPWWEVGGYLQTALRADGHFDYAGVKLRSKFVSPPSFHPNLRLGVNLEVSYLPAAYDHDRWGAEIRPIVGWQDARWLVVVNPIVDLQPRRPRRSPGPELRAGPQGGPQPPGDVRRRRRILRIDRPHRLPLPRRAAGSHVLFGVLDVEAFRNVEVDLGLGGGLTPASAGLVGKIILGYTFELRKPAPARLPAK